ncbi:MAG: LemA family protein [Bdellovibrionales bacterium]|jgi:LemA protein|nr:LemA family protein [Bdellovibrionales bacterium]
MSAELLLLLGALAVGIVLMYNSLIAKKNEIENALGGVHTYLKKRADLIPNLVATIQQFTQHESKLLTELTAARTASAKANSDSITEVDSMMSKAFAHVTAVAENYPELKSSQNFLGLQASLNEIEGQLSAARRTYNAAVVRYNTAIESIPTVIIASALGYQRKPVFQVTAQEAQTPNIANLFGKAG